MKGVNDPKKRIIEKKMGGKQACDVETSVKERLFVTFKITSCCVVK